MLSTGELISIIAAILFSVGGGVFAFFKWGMGTFRADVNGFKNTADKLSNQIDALVSDEELDAALKKIDERFKGVGKRFGDFEKELRDNQRELSEFKLKAAETYVTKSDLTLLQDRLEKMINDLGKHVDSKIDELRKFLMELNTRRPTTDG